MPDAWYYKSRDEVHGPLSFNGMLEKGRSGEILLDDLIRLGSRGEWVSVESVSPLSAVVKMAAPVQPADRSDSEDDKEYCDLSEIYLVPTKPPQSVEGSGESAAVEEPAAADWYARVLGSEMGPMPFNDLQAMAEHGELSAGDMVRCGADGEWVAAEAVSGLLVETTVDSTTASERSEPAFGLDDFQFVDRVSDAISASKAATVSSEPPVSAERETPDPEQAAVAGETSNVQHAPGLEQRGGVDQADAVEQTDESESSVAVETDSHGSPVPPPSAPEVPEQQMPEGWRRAQVKPVVAWKPARRRRRRILAGLALWLSQIPTSYKLAAVATVAVIVSVVVLFSSGGSERDYYDVYTEIWNKHKQLRDSSASDAQWARFSEDVRRQLEPIIADLERTAGAKQPIKQNLLWAGRDYLPLMISGARVVPNEAEEMFAGHLEDVRRMLIGEEPRPRTEEYGEPDDVRWREGGDFQDEESGQLSEPETVP